MDLARQLYNRAHSLTKSHRGLTLKRCYTRAFIHLVCCAFSSCLNVCSVFIFYVKRFLKCSYSWGQSFSHLHAGASIPPEAMMHFPCFRFPLFSTKFSDSVENFPNVFLVID